jgi:putative antitoxin of VapBC-like toxin-antitoxin system
MPTNLASDDRLTAEAQELGHHRTKKETVTATLDEYIKRRKQQSVLSFFWNVSPQNSSGRGIKILAKGVLPRAKLF